MVLPFFVGGFTFLQHDAFPDAFAFLVLTAIIIFCGQIIQALGSFLSLCLTTRMQVTRKSASFRRDRNGWHRLAARHNPVHSARAAYHQAVLGVLVRPYTLKTLAHSG